MAKRPEANWRASSHDEWRALALERPLLFLDIETRPDDLARRLAQQKGTRSTLHLREIVNVSCLHREAAAQGKWLLRSFHRESVEEADLLENVDAILSGHVGQGGALITYNGVEHDLPVLRARQVRWWQCHRAGLLPYLEGEALHVDVFQAFTRAGRPYGRLADACASVGIALRGPTLLEVDRLELAREQEKGEVDVVGTAAAFFYLCADRSAAIECLAEGLAGLGQFLAHQATYSPHLRAMANNPNVAASAGPWGKQAWSAAPRPQSRTQNKAKRPAWKRKAS